MNKKFLFSVIILLVIGSGYYIIDSGFLSRLFISQETADPNITHEDSHFGFMHPKHLSVMNEMEVYWQRPHAGPFIWDKIEAKPNSYRWLDSDDLVLSSQKHEINILATIWPYAEWDQEKCNEKLSAQEIQNFRELGEYRQKPCDLDAYKRFVKALVERYDGDGVNDMLGLRFPVKYWEVSNEPSMQREPVFFKGSPEDYVEILKATYEAVKEADQSAIVLQGGMASLNDDAMDFWDQVFRLGGERYFDISNIHSIGWQMETLFAPEFREYLDSRNINKSFWVTEAEYSARGLGGDRLSSEEWGKFMIKSFVRAFAAGAEKVFYVGLEDSPGDPESWLFRNSEKQDVYWAYQTMVEKIDYFSSVEQVGDGVYRFNIGDREVFVLWKNVPSGIDGNVKVTYWDGREEFVHSSDIILDGEPIFLEEM